MMEQHSQAHSTDRDTTDRGRREYSGRESRFHKRRGRAEARGYQRHARAAQVIIEESESDESNEDDEEHEGAGYYGGGIAEAEDDPEPETVEDNEIEVYTCMMCHGPFEEDAIASLVQAETTAFLAWGKASGKGGSKGKGKKGKMRRPRFAAGAKPRLPLADRKQALTDLKKRTKCNDCGQIGHWAHDPGCKKQKPKDKTARSPIADKPYQDWRTGATDRQEPDSRCEQSSASLIESNLTYAEGSQDQRWGVYASHISESGSDTTETSGPKQAYMAFLFGDSDDQMPDEREMQSADW